LTTLSSNSIRTELTSTTFPGGPSPFEGRAAHGRLRVPDQARGTLRAYGIDDPRQRNA
jgi:hypothetical protein